MYDVVALGELLIDFVQNGESVQGNPLFEANPGGAPCNSLAMLQKLGYKTAFIGKVGNDTFGKALAEAIEKVGINPDGVVYDDEVKTTLALVHTYQDGDRDFSFYRKPGADMMLREDEIDYDIIDQCRVFHFGTLSLTDEPVATATRRAVAYAREKGKLLSFDPNYRPPLWDDEEKAKEAVWFGIENCDILKIADNEIQWLTGEEEYDKGIAKIREHSDIKLINLTLGKEGSQAYYRDMKVFADPVLTDETIDTTGAGDTFGGTVLGYILKYGLDNLTEANLIDMLQTANKAASIVTTRRGALKVMPDGILLP